MFQSGIERKAHGHECSDRGYLLLYHVYYY